MEEDEDFSSGLTMLRTDDSISYAPKAPEIPPNTKEKQNRYRRSGNIARRRRMRGGSVRIRNNINKPNDEEVGVSSNSMVGGSIRRARELMIEKRLKYMSDVKEDVVEFQAEPFQKHFEIWQSSVEDNEIVYLNIGGYEYTTDKATLLRFGPNYFTGLLTGKFNVMKDENGRYFINRPGKYFEALLEFLMTGDVIVPEGMSIAGLVREARFYCIHFPLDEMHENMSFVTGVFVCVLFMVDKYLKTKKVTAAYNKIRPVADSLLSEILKQLIAESEKGSKLIESVPILMEDQSRVDSWLDTTEHGNAYWRFEFLDRQKKLYEQDCIVSDKYFTLLDNTHNQRVITTYCKYNGLSIGIIPINIHEPGVTNRRYFTLGYKIVHQHII